MRIETRIAKASKGQVELRDVQANYHKMTYNALVKDFPGIDWGNLSLSTRWRRYWQRSRSTT